MPRSLSLLAIAALLAPSSVLVLDPLAAAAAVAPAAARPTAGDDRLTVLEDAVLRLPAPGLLANDTGSGRLRAEVVREPRRATLRVTPAGAVRLQPRADANGTITFAYRALDPAGRRDRAVVTVRVVPVNDAPSFAAGPDQEVRAGAGPQEVPGWATRIDPGARNERRQSLAFEVDEVGDPTLFTPDGLPAITPDGTLTYTPAATAEGSTTVEVTLTDDGGVADGGVDRSDTAELLIEVGPPAAAPTFSTGDGRAVVDPGSSVLLVPQLELDDDGDIAAATVRLPEDAGLSLTATPPAGIAADTTSGRLELSGRASASAYREALRSVVVAAPAGATAGVRELRIEVEDVDGLTADGVRSVVVTRPADPDRPTVTAPDAIEGDEDTTLTGNVLANDRDLDDVLTVVGHTAADYGNLIIAPDGDVEFVPDPDWHGAVPTVTYTTNTGATETLDLTVLPVDDAPVAVDDEVVGDEDTTLTADLVANDLDADGDTLTAELVTAPRGGTVVLDPDGTLTFTPLRNRYFTQTFTYRVFDGTSYSAPATVTLVVRPVNDAPVAQDDDASGDEDTDLTGDVLTNDSDVDGDLLTAVLGTGPTHGTVDLDTDGSFTYTPDADWHGTDTFTYRADDGELRSAPATVTLTVRPVNDAPVARDDAVTGDEGTVISGGVLDNDTDVDGDRLQASLATGPVNGLVNFNSDGTFGFIPTAGWSGTETFTYVAYDGTATSAPATVTITVRPVNHAPVDHDDDASGDEDTDLTGDVLANDQDPDGDLLTAVLGTGPLHGTLDLEPDGTFTYTPDADWHGTDTFTYRADDGGLRSAPATVTLTVRAVNDAPVARDDSFTIGEDERLSLPPPFTALTGNDTDVDGDALTVVSVAARTHGSLDLVGDSVVFTPTRNHSGPATFAYSITDGHGGVATATVHLTITPVDDPTVTQPDTDVIDEDTEATGNVLANDTDPDDVLTVTDHTDPAHGTLTLTADGDYRYTPDRDWHGTEPTITYTTNTGATGTLDITVTPVNDPPSVRGALSLATDEDTSVSAEIWDGAADPEGGTLTAVIQDGVDHGSLLLNTATGWVLYTPNRNFHGADTFTIRTYDRDGGYADTEVTVTVRPVNDAPTAQGDAASGDEDTDLTGAVLDNDRDAENDPLTAVLVTGPAHGSLTLNADGSFTYRPQADWNGTDTFTYRADDGRVTSAPATVTLTVRSVNDPPVVTPTLAVATDEDTSVSIEIWDGAVDPEGSTLFAIIQRGVAHGGLLLNTVTGRATYSPNRNFHGTDTFTIRTFDRDGGYADTEVTVTVRPVNDAPVAVADAFSTSTGTPVTGNVLANDTDVEGDPLSVELVTGPAYGSLTINADGSFTYSPSTGFAGTDSFTYRTRDPGASSQVATVTITVGA